MLGHERPHGGQYVAMDTVSRNDRGGTLSGVRLGALLIMTGVLAWNVIAVAVWTPDVHTTIVAIYARFGVIWLVLTAGWLLSTLSSRSRYAVLIAILCMSVFITAINFYMCVRHMSV